MSGAGAFAGGASTGMSTVIVRDRRPGPLGLGTFPVAVMRQAACFTPEGVYAEPPPAHVTVTGQSNTPDHVMHVDDVVHAADELGDCWPTPPFGAIGAHVDAIVVSAVGLWKGCRVGR